MKTHLSQVDVAAVDWSTEELLPFRRARLTIMRVAAWYRGLFAAYPKYFTGRGRKWTAPAKAFLAECDRFERDFAMIGAEPAPPPGCPPSWCDGTEPALMSRDLLALCVIVNALASVPQGRALAGRFIATADRFIAWCCENSGHKSADVHAAARRHVLSASGNEWLAFPQPA